MHLVFSDDEHGAQLVDLVVKQSLEVTDGLDRTFAFQDQVSALLDEHRIASRCNSQDPRAAIHHIDFRDDDLGMVLLTDTQYVGAMTVPALVCFTSVSRSLLVSIKVSLGEDDAGHGEVFP
ncbi:hypothetical protein D3C78_1396430 [compost metagenome]